MKLLNTLKLGLAAALVALLAACGGSESPAAAGADPAKPLPEVPWGSPAVFVTPGQTSASFALSGCALSVNDADDFYGPLYQAKLVITSGGDVSIMATTSSVANAVPETIINFKYAEVDLANWGVQGTVETPTYSIHMRKFGTVEDAFQTASRLGVNYLNFANGGSGDGFGGVGIVMAYNNANRYSIDGTEGSDCKLDTPLALQTLINEARVAKHMAKGVTEVGSELMGISDPESGFEIEILPSSVEGDLISWAFAAVDLGGGGGDESFLDFPQANYRFNSASGVLSTSTGTDTSAPMTTVSFALPSGATEQQGYYQESTCRNTEFYNFQEAKTLFVLKDEDVEGFVIATRVGDKLMPMSFIAFFYYAISGQFDSVPDCIRPNLK
jgi:hypothetical protein